MLNSKVSLRLRIQLLICLAMLVSNPWAWSQIPGLAWAKNMGGSDALITGRSVAVDLSGNVYTTGHFSGTADFDPGSGISELTANDNDGFVTRFDASGNFEWVMQFGAAQSDAGTSIAVDGAGNIVVAGYFAETVDFDPGASNFELAAFGEIDAVILKLAPNGNFIFAKQIGGVDNEYITSVQADGSSNIYITGTFTDVVDFDPGAAVFDLTSNGLTDAFVTKLDADGNFEWAAHFGGSGDDQDAGESLAVDPGGNVYVAGEYGDGDFDDDLTIFINKLDNDGNPVWNYEIAGVSNNYVHSIEADAAGDIYFSGRIDNNTVDFDPLGTGFSLTGRENYVCKLNTSGILVWAIGLGPDLSVASMALDINGNIFLTGSNGNTEDIDPGPGVASIFSFGEDNGLFILKLDNSGNYVWSQGFNKPLSSEAGNFITTDNTGNIYVMGEFDETINLATGICSTAVLTSSGVRDLFLMKLNPSSVPATCFGVIEQPLSGDACEETNVWLSAPAGGTSRVTYQWQEFDGTAFVNISDQWWDEDGTNGYEGTNTPNLYIFIANGSGTEQYRCRISGESVADTFSDVATLTLSGSNSIPYVVANSGCGPGQFMITASGGTEGSYQWYENDVLIDGEVNSTYTTPLISAPTQFSVSKGIGSCISTPVEIEVNTDACAPVPGLVWVAQPQTDASDDVNILKMVIDASGNIYAMGYFTGTADFDTGPGTATLTTVVPTDRENFLLKLTRDRDVLWVKSLNNINFLNHGISLDGAGSIYISGSFRNTIDFDPGPAIFNMTATGNLDMYVTKLDTDGNFIWAKRMGGSGSNSISSGSVTSDVNGVYTTGGFTGTIDFDPNAGTQFRSSAGSTLFSDIFISKLDPNGNFAWAYRMGATSATDGGRAIKVDGSGNVYSVGTFFGTVDFDPGAGTATLTGGGATDTYIHKMNNAGIFQWARTIGGAGVEIPIALAIDASGNPHITGTFGTIITNQTVDFDPGVGTFNLVSNEGIIFILKLLPDGTFAWAKNFGGTFATEPRDITVDVSGNVLMTGYAEGNYDFDPGPGVYRLKSNVNRDIVVTQFDAGGNFSWAFNMASTGLSYFSNGGVSIVTDPDGSIYTAGAFSHSSDFDPGHCTYPLFAPDGSSFIQKIRPGVATLCFNEQPLAAAGCTGTPATLRAAATGTTNITYQWQKLNTTTSLFENITDAGGYSGVTSPDLEIDTNGNFGAGSYQCRVTGDNAPDKNSNQVSLTVNIIPSPPGVTGSTSCSGLPQTLTASGSADGNYRWYDVSTDGTPVAGEINSTYTTPPLTEETAYYVSIANAFCESTRTVVVAAISVPTQPAITPSGPIIFCPEESVTLSAPPASAFTWSTGETTQEITVNTAGDYFVSTTDEYGCTSPASNGITVTIQNCADNIIVYNALSPNGDDMNDLFIIQNIDANPEMQNNKVTIFNRWGDVVSEIENYDNSERVFKGLNKSGNEVPSGTYFYKIEFNSGRETRMGYLVLKR